MPSRNVLLFLLLSAIARGATAQAPPPSASAAPPRLESCKPVSERTGVEGCWIMASTPVGTLSADPVFWTLDSYATREAAQAALTRNGTVVEALGKIWLFTIGDTPKPPSGGRRVTRVGPLPVLPNVPYTAQYREAILQPGAVSRTHLHAGPEAFYTETGESCLETPAGMQVGRNGVPLIAPAGQPMELVATGKDVRRGIVLVLHNSSEPHTTLVTDWKSKGLCKQGTLSATKAQ